MTEKKNEDMGKMLLELLKLKASERSPRMLMKRLQEVNALLYSVFGVPQLGDKIASTFFELYIPFD